MSEPWNEVPVVPGATASSAVAPNGRAATRGVTKIVGGPAGGVSSVVRTVCFAMNPRMLAGTRSSEAIRNADARPKRDMPGTARRALVVVGTVSTTILPAAASAEIQDV